VSEVPTLLRTIAESARRRIEAARAAHVAPTMPARPAPNRFLDALRTRSGAAIIAEVKLGSPRLGSLRERVDPLAQAGLYAGGGAAALSVVVEPDHFFGSYALLSRCAASSGLPALAKDFVLDPMQIEWAYTAGASAVLLIAALLAPQQLQDLAEHARCYGLVPLVETHDPEDLAKLTTSSTSSWELVGINNRDLRTFEVDLERSLRLVDRIPQGALRVAESGIGGAADLLRLRAGGFDAFLIGESLLLASDPRAKLRELVEAAGADAPAGAGAGA
jgi:indole-3-glycerol phosphate synthase